MPRPEESKELFGRATLVDYCSRCLEDVYGLDRVYHGQISFGEEVGRVR